MLSARLRTWPCELRDWLIRIFLGPVTLDHRVRVSVGGGRSIRTGSLVHSIFFRSSQTVDLYISLSLLAHLPLLI